MESVREQENCMMAISQRKYGSQTRQDRDSNKELTLAEGLSIKKITHY